MYLNPKLVTTLQRPTCLGSVTEQALWTLAASPFSPFVSFPLAPSTPLTALHSNCVFVCLGAVVLIGEVSKHLGGLYNNCDKVESLVLIVVQSCWSIFLLQKNVAVWQIISACTKLLWNETLASSAFCLIQLRLLCVRLPESDLFSVFTCFIYSVGSAVGSESLLADLGLETDAFLLLSFVTVVFCKWQCWVITCVKNHVGEGSRKKRGLREEEQEEEWWWVSKHQALIGHQMLAVWHHWGC